MSTITVTFDPPTPADSPSAFNTKAFATLGDLNTWSTQANTVAGEVNTNASTASTAATTATTQAGTATSAASTASSAASSATTSASTATTQASNASSSASAAAISESNAAASAAATAGAIVAERSASRALTNLTGLTVVSGGASIAGNVAVTGAGSFTDYVKLATTKEVRFYNAAANNWAYIYSPLTAGDSEVDLKFVTKTGSMILDASGNLGLGVTPSAGNKLEVKHTNGDKGIVIETSGVAGSIRAVDGFGLKFLAYKLGFQINDTDVDAMILDASGNLLVGTRFKVSNNSVYDPVGGQAGIAFGAASILPTGNTGASTDNATTLGAAGARWSTVYAGTGSINTSDAREKTPIRTLVDAEVEAAKALSKEIGIYQFLESVAKKGDKARQHVGMTVQRAVDVMEAHGLDPMAYGFICHDAWDAETKEVDATEDDDGAYSINSTPSTIFVRIDCPERKTSGL